MLLRRRRAMVCRQVVEVVTDYLEGTMAARERARFEAHLAGCPHCREYLAQMRKTLEILGRIEPEELAPEVQDELVALYRRWRAD
ncbi:MAG TPA: zf-HC2 domain-containing protein [Acidimicrobiales bacterium]|nr:zf-HC2 domain-containing protein [Acidimicrobiales bacterium]